MFETESFVPCFEMEAMFGLFTEKDVIDIMKWNIIESNSLLPVFRYIVEKPK